MVRILIKEKFIKIIKSISIIIMITFIFDINILATYYASNNNAYSYKNISNNVKNLDYYNENFCYNYNNLSLKFLKQLNVNNNDNIVISPISIISLLGMIASGASGESLREIENLLESKQGISNFNYNLKKYIELLSMDKNNALNLASSIWVSDSYNYIKKEYIKNIKNNFNAENYFVNFSDKNSINMINKWCSDKTNNLLNEIVEESMFNQDTIIAIISAMLFESNWENPYKLSWLKKDTFYGLNFNSLASMMSSIENWYIKGDEEEGFIKNFENNRFAFMALLPNEDIKINDYIDSFINQKLTSLIERKINQDIYVTIPKFSLNYQTSLNQVLQNLGVKSAFKYEKSNFKNMVNNYNNITLSEVIHKTFIDVNLQGVKVGSLSSAIFEKCMLINIDELEKVHFNRPFLFFIIDQETNMIITLGVCKNL